MTFDTVGARSDARAAALAPLRPERRGDASTVGASAYRAACLAAVCSAKVKAT